MSYTIPTSSYVQIPTYTIENDGSQLFVGFETSAQIVADMAEDLTEAYSALEDDDSGI